jgi:hypothetical protein
MLEDPTAEWVSFVDHGANWDPLRMIIQRNDAGRTEGPVIVDKGGAKMPGAVIQSLLLPGSQELEELAANPEFAWLRDLVATTKRANLAHNRYVFADRSKFEQGSFRAVALGTSGALLTVGDLTEESKGQGTAAKAAPADLVAAMADSQEDIIARLIGDETWRWEDILFNSLRQVSADPKKRKQTIMNALSAYWDFLNNILDVAPQTQMKLERPVPRTDTTETDNHNDGNGQAKTENRTKTITRGDTDMDANEVTALVAKSIEAKLTELKAELAKGDSSAADANKPATLADVVKGVTDMAAVVTGLSDAVKEIKSEISDLKKTAGPVQTDAQPETKTEGDPPALSVNEAIEAMKAQISGLEHAVHGTPPPSDPRVQTVAAKGETPGSWTNMAWGKK